MKDWIDVPFWFAWMCWGAVFGLPILAVATILAYWLGLGRAFEGSPAATLFVLAFFLDTTRIAAVVSRELHRRKELRNERRREEVYRVAQEAAQGQEI